MLIPQWGGISLLASASKEAFKTAMSHYLHHLYQLLHAPETNSMRVKLDEKDVPITFDRHPDGHIPAFMVRQMKRSRMLECFEKSKATLSALIRLTERIPTMTIRDQIAARVGAALHPLRRSAYTTVSPNWADTKMAFVESDKAFFDETMVSQLYFPDEHTFAIYLPLFLPITISLIMITVKELKTWLKRRRQRHSLKKMQ